MIEETMDELGEKWQQRSPTKVCPECGEKSLQGSSRCNACDHTFFGESVPSEKGSDVVPVYLPPMLFLVAAAVLIVSPVAALLIGLSSVLMMPGVARRIRQISGINVPLGFSLSLFALSMLYALLMPLWMITPLYPEDSGVVRMTRISHRFPGLAENPERAEGGLPFLAARIFVDDQTRTATYPRFPIEERSVTEQAPDTYRVEGAVTGENLFRISRTLRFSCRVRKVGDSYSVKNLTFY